MAPSTRDVKFISNEVSSGRGSSPPLGTTPGFESRKSATGMSGTMIEDHKYVGSNNNRLSEADNLGLASP